MTDLRVLGGLIDRDRRSGDPALRAPGAGRDRGYDYRRLGETAAQTGNLFRHLGVRRGDGVALAADPDPRAILALMGAVAVGARVRLAAGVDSEDTVTVAPTRREDSIETAPGATLVAYGEAPARAGTVHWERDVAGENTALPPTEVGPEDPVFADDGWSHEAVLAAAERLAARVDFDGTVALRVPLERPRAVVAGVVAPLLRGGTILLPPDAPGGDAAAGDVAVVDGDRRVPEPDRVRLDDVDR